VSTSTATSVSNPSAPVFRPGEPLHGPPSPAPKGPRRQWAPCVLVRIDACQHRREQPHRDAQDGDSWKRGKGGFPAHLGGATSLAGGRVTAQPTLRAW
jgi:hypothetical protein